MTEIKQVSNEKYPRLAGILEILELDTSITVQEIYGGQLGHLVFSHKELIDLDDSEKPITDFESLTEKHKKDESWESIGKEFTTAISNHHNIFNLSNTDDKQFTVEHEHYGRWVLNAEEPVTMTIKIPSTHKEFQWGFSGINIEEFEVYTLGSTYCAVTPLKDAPQLFHVGHEFREQIRSSLDSSQFTYRLGQVGPSPIHPHFYLLCVDGDEFDTPLIKEYENDLYMFSSGVTKDNFKDIFISMLSYMQYPLEQFFSHAITRSMLLDLHTEIESRLKELIDNYASIQSNIFGINILKYKEVVNARKNLLDLHNKHFEFEKYRNFFEREKKLVLRDIENNAILENLYTYFKEQQDLEVKFDSSFDRTVDYLDRSISISDQGQRSLIAAVLGAAIGAMLVIVFQ